MSQHSSALPRLLVLTDRAQLPPGRTLLGTLEQCRVAGLTHIVLRESDWPIARRAELAVAASELGLTVIAAHHPLPGAVGVHLPARVDASDESGLRGRSCHSRADVERAAVEGFDYATLGPFAVTASKPGYGPALAPEEYRDHRMAVYALGGVSPDNLGDALAAGATGVAVMGAVMRAHDPAQVVHALLAALTRPSQFLALEQPFRPG